MPTDPQQDIKTMSFRVSRELWIRIGDAARRLGVSTQAFCTEAIEKHLGQLESKKGNGDVNGKSVRSKLPELFNSSKGKFATGERNDATA
jgi:hypothetical protein